MQFIWPYKILITDLLQNFADLAARSSLHLLSFYMIAVTGFTHPMAQPTRWHKSHFTTSQFSILLVFSCVYSRMVLLNDEHVTLQLCEAGTKRGSNIAL